MPKLRVLKTLRLDASAAALSATVQKELERSGVSGATYIVGDLVEPNAREAATLKKLFPDHFADA